MKPLTKLKLGILVLVVLAMMIFIALNTQVIELNLLVARVSMSRSLLLIAILFAGFVLGWISRSFGSLREHLSKLN